MRLDVRPHEEGECAGKSPVKQAIEGKGAEAHSGFREKGGDLGVHGKTSPSEEEEDEGNPEVFRKRRTRDLRKP